MPRGAVGWAGRGVAGRGEVGWWWCALTPIKAEPPATRPSRTFAPTRIIPSISARRLDGKVDGQRGAPSAPLSLSLSLQHHQHHPPTAKLAGVETP
jgi:hypothetical protein